MAILTTLGSIAITALVAFTLYTAIKGIFAELKALAATDPE